MYFIPFQTADGNYLVSYSDKLVQLFLNNTNFNERKCLHLIAARVCGTTYANYLRWGRDEYNGKIVGKNLKYPHLLFENKKDCENLCTKLNFYLKSFI